MEKLVLTGGAANGDCDHCPVKDGDEDEKDTNY